MIKRIFILGIVCAIALSFSIHSYGDALFGKEYYNELRKYIAQAEESIVVAMYFIIMEPRSPVNTLVDDLIAAKETRGKGSN